MEDEIQTLSQVLAAKEKQLADIKRKLGITPLNELKQNITKTWQEVTTSTASVPRHAARFSECLSLKTLKKSPVCKAFSLSCSQEMSCCCCRGFLK